MAGPRIKYAEGDLFAVPLDGGGYGIALITRLGHTLLALGYFYGPRRALVPRPDEVGVVSPEAAALVCKFSALGIRKGWWPRIGQLPGWDRTQWPVPGFNTHLSNYEGQPIRIDLDDHDISREVGRRLVSPKEHQGLADSGTYGSGAVEIVLSKCLPPLADGVVSDSTAPERHATAEELSGETLPALDDEDNDGLPKQLIVAFTLTGEWGTEAERATLDEIEFELDRVLGDLGQIEGNEVGGGQWRVFVITAVHAKALAAIRPVLVATGLPWFSNLSPALH